MQTFWKLTSIEYNSLINEFVYSKRLLGLNSLCIQKDVTSFKEEIFIGKQENIILKTLFIKLYYSLFVQIFYQQILNSHFYDIYTH